MNKLFIKLLYILVLSGLIPILSGCGTNDEGPDYSWKDSSLCHQLIGTSWQLYSIAWYHNDGMEVKRSDGLRPIIYTFTDEEVETHTDWGITYVIKVYNRVLVI